MTTVFSDPGLKLGVEVPNSALTDVIEVDTQKLKTLSGRFEVAEQALNGFAIYMKIHSAQDAWDPLFDTAEEFTNPRFPMVAVGRADGETSDLTTLPAGGTGWFRLNVEGFARVKILAKSAHAAGSVIDAHLNVSGGA
jgi:hypothetical protein